MTSRERLLAAIDRRPVDRAPVSTYELVGWDSRAWENQEPSYARLMDAIRTRTDCVAMWNPASTTPSRVVETGREVDGHWTTIRHLLPTPKGDLTQTLRIDDRVHTVWQVEHWCKSSEDVDRYLSVPYEPARHTGEDYPRIRAEVGDRGILMASTGDALLLAAELMSMEDYLVWAMTETDHFAATVATLHERNQASVKDMLTVAPVDLVRICGPEYATPPYLPPSYFERFVLPYVSEQVDLIHGLGVKARLHCHGRIGRVLDMIAATGADATDPCEAPPDGDIELAEVKRRVGDRMCLFGNLQLKLLETATEEQVRAEVRRCLEAAGPTGYVIMPTAAPINVPLAPQTEANYLAFIDEANR